MLHPRPGNDPIANAWHDLVRRRGLPARAAQAVLDQVLAAYAEPHRAYHTGAHIGHLLRLLDAHGGAVADRDALVLAILFHDLVYDPARSDNEAESARRAGDMLAPLGLPPELAAKVERTILATRHGADLGATDDPDLSLLLDLDLSILAAEEPTYRAYAQAIRHEYRHVPDALYRSGRRQVLQAFVARERIYRTALGADWEARARTNLAAELAELG